MTSLILASQSPRRKQLLQWADLSFIVQVSGTDENIEPGTTPKEAALQIALEKAWAVKNSNPHTDSVILAADTMVVLDNEMLGKPAGRDEAIAFLMRLQGRTHEVITGVVILPPVGDPVLFAAHTKVSFKSFTGKDAEYYTDRYSPYDKAGAYAIQEWIGVTAIDRIEGCFYNVMGLPVSRVLETFRQLGYDFRK